MVKASHMIHSLYDRKQQQQELSRLPYIAYLLESVYDTKHSLLQLLDLILHVNLFSFGSIGKLKDFHV